MSESPSDLAVAFRSFGRRLDEALAPLDEPGVDAPLAKELAAQLHGVLAEAAQEVKAASASGDARATGAAVADAIASVPADQWDAGRLDRLRSLALEGGRLLRQIESAVAAAKN